MSHRQGVALVTSTAAGLPARDPEVPLIAAGLERAGLRGDVVPWDAELDWAAYELVVVRSPWDHVERLTAFRTWVAHVDTVTHIVNPADVIRWNSHKGYLVELAAHGVATVPTTLIPGGSLDVEEQLEECGWDEVVVGPAVGGGAGTTVRARLSSARAVEHAQHLAHLGDVIVQRFVPEALDLGMVSLVFFGGALSHAVRTGGTGGPDGEDREPGQPAGHRGVHEPSSPQVRTALSALSKAPGRLTYARVDLVEVDAVPSVTGLGLVEADLFLRSTDGAAERFVGTLVQELDR